MPDAGGLDPQEIERLEALLEKATPGPWIVENHGITIAVHSTVQMDDGEVFPHHDWIVGYMQASNCPRFREDAAFIVALVNAAPSLLHSARVLQEIRWMAEQPRTHSLNWSLAEAERLVGERT